jgi:eukaryotic-like serine/threonine-protein kinase
VSDLRARLEAALAQRYTIERELGRGGMATVYLAHDRQHDRHVALKALHPELAETLGGHRFKQEIQLAGRLQHPHILAVYDSGEADGLLWFTMPHVRGESLRARINRVGPLPVEEAVAIAREVADALDYAHRQGVIHRDVKPDNIMFADEHALVTDFGIARVVKTRGQSPITSSGVIVGTPAYMSPEQATGEQKVDHRTDVYGLGAVLYEMLVGEAPFTGATPQTIIARTIHEPPRSIRTVREAVPAPLESVVFRAMAKHPADP